MTHLNRNRLKNAIVFFADSVLYCGKIKLFKLLYLMDFEHFSQTGKSITGVEYQAWKFGPVPIELMEEWDDLSEDLEKVIHIQSEQVIDYRRDRVVVNDGVTFDDENFTERQLRIMQALAEKYRDTYSPKMIDVTHEQNSAWDKVWQNGLGARKEIPYELAISDDVPERGEILAIARERSMYLAALNAARNVESMSA